MNSKTTDFVGRLDAFVASLDEVVQHLPLLVVSQNGVHELHLARAFIVTEIANRCYALWMRESQTLVTDTHDIMALDNSGRLRFVRIDNHEGVL